MRTQGATRSNPKTFSCIIEKKCFCFLRLNLECRFLSLIRQSLRYCFIRPHLVVSIFVFSRIFGCFKFIEKRSKNKTLAPSLPFLFLCAPLFSEASRLMVGLAVCSKPQGLFQTANIFFLYFILCFSDLGVDFEMSLKMVFGSVFCRDITHDLQ